MASLLASPPLVILKGFHFRSFEFVIIPMEDFRLGENPGALLRGAFGLTLRRLCCDNFSLRCEECERRLDCPYFFLFSPSGVVSMSGYRFLPRGYVLKLPLSPKETFSKENPLVFRINFIGSAIQCLPHTATALRMLGNHGIGKNRSKFALSRVIQLDGEERYDVLRPEGELLPLDKDCRLRFLSEVESLVMNFTTPTRIRYKKEVVRDPEFQHIFKRLRDRISILSHFYCGFSLQGAKCKELGLLSEKVEVINKEMRWVNMGRRSKAGPWHDQSGFVGDMAVNLKGKEELLEFLLIGEHVHVGEDATFGSGSYTLKKIP